MIDLALVPVVNELNEFLRIKFKLKDDRAVIANILTQDGSSSIKEDNRILVSVVNIEEEKLATPRFIPNPGINKPVYLNIYLLFSAAFNPTLNIEGLKFISAVIAFFQSKPLFEPQNTPGLDPSIEKMVFEIYSLTLQEQSNLWASIGAKYMPSVLYKIRVIGINEAMMTYEAPGISEVERNPSAK